jgi:PadR family transcriptional regulator PadR
VTSASAATAKWEVQVRKGVLEFIVLLTIRSSETYGYELVTTIARALDFELTEGTIYPLLSRLNKEGLIAARWVATDGGVPRKYYRLSARGQAVLEAMEISWLRMTRGVQQLTSPGGARSRGASGEVKER